MNNQKICFSIAIVCLSSSAQLSAQTDRSSSFSYNTLGQVISMDGPRTDLADTTSLSYHASGELSNVVNALGQQYQYNQYDNNGNLLSATDVNGVITQFAYDSLNRLTSFTPAFGTALESTTQLNYDNYGNLTQIVDPLGRSTTFEYDDANRLIKISDNLNNRIEFSLDVAGNLLNESIYNFASVLYRTYNQSFDELSRQLTLVGAGLQTEQYSYDNNGNRIDQTDGNNNLSSANYDGLDRTIQNTDPYLNSSSIIYNERDQIESVTDERGVTTTYSYNDFGEIVSQISSDTGQTTYQYDPAGNLTEMVDARGEVATYSYDALNRITGTSYSSDSSLNESYNYDQGSNGVGQLTGMSDFSGTTSFTYDELGRLTSDSRQIYGISYSTGYQYDLAGAVSKITYPSGIEVSYSRDSVGRVNGVDISSTLNGDTFTVVENVNYVPFGGVASLDYGNGLSLVRQYDQDYRITNQQVTGTGFLEELGYQYDANSNITQIDDLDNAAKNQSFEYDKLDRLEEEESILYGEKTYVYDEVGNRTSRILTPPASATSTQPHYIDSASNRLLARGQRDYLYDAAGNTLAFLEPDGSPRREWDYNAANRMEELRTFGVLKARYQYNGLGQRVMKTLYKEVQGTAEENQIYVFHYDQSGRLLQTGIYRPNGPRHMRDRHFIWLDDMPVGYLETVYRVNGNVLSQDMHYLSADHLNTPRFATNENGVMSWEWTADAFGIGELDLDPDGDGVNVNMRLRFPGQYDDEESITYYNYFRDYDPTIGRYMQSDPIGLSGGLNTYWYVGGNPIGFVDPTGEWFFIPAAVVAGIGVVYGAAKVSYTTIAITYNYDFLDRGPKAQNNLDTFVETGDIDLLNDLNRYQNDNFNNVADGAQNSLDLFLSIRDVQRSIAKLCR